MGISPQQRAIFERQVLEPVVSSYRKSDQRLSGFMAMEGCDYASARKLMVVGRAVNGWGDGQMVSWLKERSTWAAFVDSIHGSENDCPLAWVSDDAGASDRYNTNFSAFWRVLKEVSRQLGVWDERNEGRWSSQLVWSNLYKVSPHTGGNPSNSLCSLQEAGCIALLREEILEYAPDRVLFLTGMTWAWPFMKGLECRLQAMGTLVDAKGQVQVSDDRAPVPFVIAAHPQGKDESGWVDEVLEAFRYPAMF